MHVRIVCTLYIALYIVYYDVVYIVIPESNSLPTIGKLQALIGDIRNA